MSDRATYIHDKAGFNNRVGYGDSPVLLIIDLQNGFTNERNPLGSDMRNVIKDTNTLLQTAHYNDIPVILSRIITNCPNGSDLGLWKMKVPTLTTLQSGSDSVELDSRLDINNSDYILDKKQASAFHETELTSMLISWGIDTVIVTGCSTSGCIRSTVIDACSQGYHTIVPDGAVGDRSQKLHNASLFDIDAKYADVNEVSDVTSYLNNLNKTS